MRTDKRAQGYQHHHLSPFTLECFRHRVLLLTLNKSLLWQLLFPLPASFNIWVKIIVGFLRLVNLRNFLHFSEFAVLWSQVLDKALHLSLLQFNTSWIGPWSLSSRLVSILQPSTRSLLLINTGPKIASSLMDCLLEKSSFYDTREHLSPTISQWHLPVCIREIIVSHNHMVFALLYLPHSFWR